MHKLFSIHYRCTVFVIVLISAFCNEILFAQFDTIVIPRLKYGGGGDWYTGPTSMPNLLRALNERLNIPTNPQNIAVSILDNDLFKYPIIFMTGHGNVKFTDQEVVRLLAYLENGGFLWINDSYGMDKYIRRELKKLFPDKEFVPIPPSHPIFHQVYDFPDGIPKIHQHDGKPPQALGIFSKDRLVVFYCYESDIGDGLEDEGIHPSDTPEIREKAMRMAINIVVYALNQ